MCFAVPVVTQLADYSVASAKVRESELRQRVKKSSILRMLARSSQYKLG